MKKYTLLCALCAMILVSCDPPRDYKVSGLVKERKWSGYHTRLISGMPGHDSAYHRTFTDTVFAVAQLTDSIIKMPVPGLYLKFRGADNTQDFWAYDSTTLYVQRDSLKYYFKQDSVVFYYQAIYPSMYGMDAPYMEYLYLYSHR